ncbi:hypothetical protein PanWU01x14_238140 [Parasponia andersonii]|uniref:Uncharacterized protein n=1 Tax=Parasponia andersonii TaxID=3476 RepID=A0A2P5BHL8_PARAD|nr:hypothetical protein PanWU01x14_238140 [Parasponia andersonii]
MNQKSQLELIPQKIEFQVFDEMQPLDLCSVEVQILDATYHNWLEAFFVAKNFVHNHAAQDHGMGPRGSALICGIYQLSWAARVMLVRFKEERGAFVEIRFPCDRDQACSTQLMQGARLNCYSVY